MKIKIFSLVFLFLVCVLIAGCTGNTQKEELNKYQVGDIVAASENSPLGYLIVEYSPGLDSYEGYKFSNYAGKWGFIKGDDEYLIYKRELLEENMPFVIDHLDIQNSEDAYKYPTHTV